MARERYAGITKFVRGDPDVLLGQDIKPYTDEEEKRVRGIASTAGTPATTAPVNTLSPADQKSLDWATANPSDPRAAAIRQRLGV